MFIYLKILTSEGFVKTKQKSSILNLQVRMRSKFRKKSETNKRKDVLTLENIRFQSKTIGQTRKSTGWMPGH